MDRTPDLLTARQASTDSGIPEGELIRAGRALSASVYDPYRDFIEQSMDPVCDAKAIWQDLVSCCAFEAQYLNV